MDVLEPPVPLYVPATRPDRIPKALATEATRVIIDLEDAVPSTLKESARENAVQAILDHASDRLEVRINQLTSDDGVADLEALARVRENLRGIVIPKLAEPGVARKVKAQFPDVSIEGIVETPRGVMNLEDICADSALAAVSLGEEDLRRSLMLGDDKALNPIRLRLVVAHQAAGKGSPRAGAYANVRDHQGLYDSCQRLSDWGFYGRSAIHPEQISIIKQGFNPTAEDLMKAKSLLSADFDEKGAVSTPEGHLVDEPTIRWAQTVIKRSNTTL
jgi:citrate lyase subunit beta/citryl-CoA lyase